MSDNLSMKHRRSNRENAKPFFSVIVPTYNQDAFLPAALNSLFAQTFCDWEAVIVNDGSTDATAEVMRSFALKDSRLKTINQDNGGVASALNKGLSHATGEWICWLSSDDLFEPDKLEIHLKAIKNNPGIRFFHSHFYYFEDQTGIKSAPNPWYPIPDPELQVITFFKAPYIHGNSIAVHKSVFNRVGQFDENSPCGQDFDMWLRISAQFPSRYIDRRTCVTRWHAGQTTNQFPEAGFFDSARACLTFLNSHPFEELFPLLDLKKSADICKAIQATINVALNQGAIMYRLGINTALLDRMGQWIGRDCPQTLRPAVLDFIGQLVKTLESKKIPGKIRDSLCRITEPVGQPYLFSSDFAADAMAFAKEIEASGQVNEASAIRKYIAQHSVASNKLPQDTIRSNLSCCKQLQNDGYFQNHHCYKGLSAKLSPSGKFVCQFADLTDETEDAKLEIYEPSVRWNKAEIVELIRETGLKLHSIRSQNFGGQGDWHWAFFGRGGQMTHTKVLMYYEGLHNSNKPYAGTNCAMISLAQALNDLNGSIEVHLTGDYVNHEERLGRTKIIPSPDSENRQAWLSEYATIVFATHLGWFKRFTKPRHQRWILHQHCWYMGPYELRRIDDFDEVIALTAKQKLAIAGQGVPAGKISVMPNAINTALFALQPVARKPYSILFVGALVEHKGLDILLGAFPKVRQLYPQAQIHVYGDAGMWHENNRYEKHIRSMADEAVIFHGARPNAEMPGIYSSHDILCLPSRMESFGLVIIEAQACGCVPVVHDVGGTSATMEDGKTGFLYSPNDADTLSACIIKAFQTLDRSPTIRERAMEFIHTRFNLDLLAKSFLSILQDSKDNAAVENRKINRDGEPLTIDKKTDLTQQLETRCELDTIIPAEIKKDAFFEDIRRLSAESGIQHILEIGSSSGDGSTAAFVSGMVDGRSKANLYCLELSKPRFAKLQSRYQKDDQVFCYRASTVPLEKFPSEKEVADFYHQTSTALNTYPLERILGWLRQDKDYLQRSQACDRGIEQIKQQHGIEKFDLVLIDGSEFTGEAELDEIYGAGVIMLDDINGFKNYRNFHRLKQDPVYVLEKENWQLRNGYAIFRRLSTTMDVPIHFFTIVLNGEPFIRYHLEIFRRLPFQWHWHIIEGVADQKHDTAWCLKNGGRIAPDFHRNGLSIDGTSAYLDSIASKYPDQVTLYRKPTGHFWDGKLEMVNAPMTNLPDRCLLWQVDADELWTTDQIETARAMFQTEPAKTAAFFFCNFFVGPDRVTITRDTYGNHSRYEWLRIWRYSPGDFWQSHEPPRLMRPRATGGIVDVGTINPFSHADTESNGLVFQHYAYASEAQVRFKESYYGYRNAVRQWWKLQSECSFPIRLKHYFAWVKDETQVATIHSQAIKPLMVLKAAAPISINSANSKYESILWARTDSIGDAVLAAGMLPAIRGQFPNARITVVCQKLCKEIYETCPSIDGVIAIPDGHRWQGPAQFSEFLNDVKKVAPDLLLNSVYSVHEVSDIPKLDFIPKRIAMRQSRIIEYTDIIDTPRGHLSELERHKAFLKGLGIDNCPTLNPVMWLHQADHGYADAIFTKYELVPQRTIGLFVGSRLGIKQYFQWGNALSKVCQERDFKVIALGGKEDYELSQWQLEIIKKPAVNLCGKTTLRQAAAILNKCRLAVGTDTSLAHMACAMGTDNVVVLGGGHFGRFFPYSSQTIVVCNPLDCYGCEWRCRYRRPKCIHEIAPESIEIAINEALASKQTKLRLFAQTEDSSIPQGKTPEWFPNPQGVLNADVQIAYLEKHANTRPSVECHEKSGATIQRQFDDMTPTADRSVLVSAIVSTYNSEKFIKGCLEDLEAQTIADQLEIIVIDSGSQQNEGAIVKDFQSRYANIRYVRTEERESVYAAWNRGIRLARGEYITNANTDDRHRRDALEKMVDVLEAKPEIDLVYADVIKTQTPNETFDRCSPTGVLRWYDWDRQTLLDKGCFIGPQPVWRRQVHATYGYFNVNYAISADYEFWLRISQKSSFFHINTPLGLYLDHPDSIEHRHSDRKLKEDMEINRIYKDAGANAEFIGFGRDSDLPKTTTVHESEIIEMNTAINDVNHVEINSKKLTQGGLKMYSPENILSAIRYLANSEHKKELGWFLDNLIADFPDMAEAHKEKAEIAYEQQDMESAQRHYELAAKLAPDSFEFQKNLGDFRYAVQQDGNRALEMYAKALAIQPNNVETLILAGHVAVSLHQFDKARRYYSHVISIAPENHEIRHFMDKLQAMTTANAPKPPSTAELLSSAQTKCGNGDHQGAISSLEEVVNREPQNALAHNDLGVLYYDQGLKDKALYHYQKAAMLMPENQVFQKNLADLYWVEYGDAQKAMESYVAALKIDPQDVESMLGCSHICMQMEKNEDAGVFLKCILELEPWNEDALQLIGRLEQKSQSDQAAMTYDAGDMHIQTTAASGGLHDRIDDLLEVIAQSPQDANTLNDLGVMFYESGDKEKALDCYEQAVNLQPEQPNFVKNLADFYLMEQGRTKDALKLYVRVLENNPEDVDCLSCTGLICAIMGKNHDARHFYQRVLEIEPWNQAVRQAMEKLGNDQEAVDSDFVIKIATA